MKTEESLFSFPHTIGLLALMTIIWTFVLASSFEEKRTPGEILSADQSILYFIEGETMTKQLASAPAGRWSHFPMDRGTYSAPAGRGVWFACGTIEPTTNPELTPIQWKACFLPDSNQALCICVGDKQWGDPRVAAQMASLPKATRGGASVENK